MQQWNFNFNSGFITPEQMEEQRKTLLAQLRKMIDDKRCVMCENTYLIDDQITMCSINNECVDNKYGKNCENWKPLEIIE